MPMTRMDQLFWWDDGVPRDPLRVAAQVMVFGDLKDFREASEKFGADIFAKVLDNPPRGLFDPKSWCFWHKKLGRTVPTLPAQLVPWPTV